MTNPINSSEEVRKILDDTVLSSMTKKGDLFLRFYNELINYQSNSIESTDILFQGDDFDEQRRMLNKALDSKKSVLLLLSEFFPELTGNEYSIENRLASFEAGITEWVKKFSKSKVVHQSQDRFRPIEGDATWLKLLKFGKNAIFSLSTLPKITANQIRKLRKKKIKPIHYWTHIVPELTLNKWFYKNEISKAYLPLYEEVDSRFLALLNSVFEQQDEQDRKIIAPLLTKNEPLTTRDDVDQGVAKDNLAEDNTEPDNNEDKLANLTSVFQIIESIEKRFDDHTDLVFADISGNYQNVYSKIGTIELPAYFYRNSRFVKNEANIKNEYAKSTQRWHNAHRIVLEDMRLNLELYHAIFRISLSFLDIKIQLSKKIATVKDNLKEVHDYHAQIKLTIGKAHDNRDNLKKSILSVRKDIRKTYKNQKVKKLSDSLVNQNFPRLLDRLESSVKAVIYSLPEKSLVVKEKKLVGPIADNDIYQISPSELIFFESFGELKNSLQKGKLDLLKKSGDIENSIAGLSDILEYSLESSLDLVNDKDKGDEEVLSLLSKSMDRASTRVDDIQSQVLEAEKYFNDLASASLDSFKSNIYDLTNNENIYDLRFRLTKAKAVAATSALRIKVYKKLVSRAKWAAHKMLKLKERSVRIYRTIHARYAKKIKKVPISTDVSNFLAESQNRIQDLPFVYQRLFSKDPVIDDSMFIGREKELQILNTAYKKWSEEKYAATILLSEKGSGLTSLINFFIDTKKKPFPHKRLIPDQRIYDEVAFLKFLGNSLNEEFSSPEEVISTLNGYEKKHIIVLENLQMFYLREVGGFNCINLIQRIVTATNDNIFWIVSTTIYTWEYLHKAFGIDEYFEYQIYLEELDIDQVTEIIQSRNNISGYNFEFSATEEERNNKKYKRLNQAEKNEISRKKYFSNLNKFTKGNIAISLLYWQLSVDEVSDDSIKIKPFQQPDLSFISTLDNTKVFTLLATILHDGLTSEELSSVLNTTENDSHLQLLAFYEDGILMKRDNAFIVNPLIYRQVISLLKSKNLLT